MKQTFRFLINEAPFLIDDKALERCANLDPKETLKIKIDSVRKSLGIEDMADVELLVDTLYKYQEEHDAKLKEQRQRMEEEEQLELESGGNPEGATAGNGAGNVTNDPKKTSNEATLNGNGEG